MKLLVCLFSLFFSLESFSAIYPPRLSYKFGRPYGGVLYNKKMYRHDNTTYYLYLTCSSLKNTKCNEFKVVLEKFWFNDLDNDYERRNEKVLTTLSSLKKFKKISKVAAKKYRQWTNESFFDAYESVVDDILGKCVLISPGSCLAVPVMPLAYVGVAIAQVVSYPAQLFYRPAIRSKFRYLKKASRAGKEKRVSFALIRSMIKSLQL